MIKKMIKNDDKKTNPSKKTHLRHDKKIVTKLKNKSAIKIEGIKDKIIVNRKKDSE